MSRNRVEQQLRQLSALSDAQAADGPLLEAFLRNHDETAFTVLVRRYGPMVLGVCRRVLRQQADADDAFQATFLVLVRRAAQVRCRATLGNWLYGVAYRTALHARTVHARRRRLEGQLRPLAANDSPEEAAMQSELQALLDQELNALPNKYREAIVLCDLLGKTLRDAAQQLRCPEGTLCSRLARGRALLRQRLVRRGATLSVAALTVSLTRNKALASAPLVETTVKAATLVAAGNVAAASLLTPQAAALMEGVLKSMLLAKLKIATGVILLLAVLGATTTLVACHALAGPEPVTPTPPPRRAQGDRIVPAAEELKPTAERERLRYGDKTFTQWRDTLRYDLKPEVRIEALKALGAFGQNGYADEATATILDVMRSYNLATVDTDDTRVLSIAEQTLARIGPSVIPALIKRYDTGKANERLVVVGALALLNSQPDAVALLLRAVKDKDKRVRRQAVQALLSADPKSAGLIPVLIGALADEDADTRRAAATDFAWFGEKSVPAVPTLLRMALKDPSPEVRLEAMRTLIALRAQLPDPRPVIATLVTLIEREPKSDVGNFAVQFLLSLKPENKNYVPALVEALQEPRHSVAVSKQLVAALWQIGPAAKEAIPVLEKIVQNKESDPHLREAATNALHAIDVEP